MEAFFLKLLQMSLSAAVVILVVLAVRQLLRRAPKKWSYLLWSVVGFRLAVPVSLSSVFSIFRLTAIRPGAGEAVSVYVPRAVVLAPRVLLPASGTGVTAPALAPAAESAAELSLQLWPLLGIILWGIGAAALLIWGAVSYVCLHRQLIGAVRIRDGVWETDRIRVPFLLGLFRPQIYVPLHLDGETMDYVLAHESCHIRRGDHWVKCLAFLLLALHWFNPLVWVAFCLMGRDMEMSCDERVLSQRENSAKPYSLSLLSFAAVRRFPSPTPLAFGETGVRQRVRNALQWKKPRLWVTLLAAVLCIAVLVACGTDPAELKKTEDSRGKLDFSEPYLSCVGKLQGEIIPELLDPEDFETESRVSYTAKEPSLVDGYAYTWSLGFDVSTEGFDLEAFQSDPSEADHLSFSNIYYTCRTTDTELPAHVEKIRNAMTESFGAAYAGRFAEYRYNLSDYVEDPLKAGVGPDYEVDEYGNEYRTIGNDTPGMYSDLWIVAENPEFPPMRGWEPKYIVAIVSVSVTESYTEISVLYRPTPAIPEIY